MMTPRAVFFAWLIACGSTKPTRTAVTLPLKWRGGPPSPYLPNATQVAADEGFLQPFASTIVDFRTNPIAKEYITLAKLVDAVPTWLEDLFIPLFLPGSEVTIPINRTIPLDVPIGPVKIPLPANITIVNLTLNDLNEFKELRPLDIMKGGIYTWGGTIDLKATTCIINAKLDVLGHEVDVSVHFTLQNPSIDFAAVIGFQTTRVCEVWGALMRSSKSCSVWPFLAVPSPTGSPGGGVSGFNITTLRIAVTDFGFNINVTGLGDKLDGIVEQELESLINSSKASIIANLPVNISNSVRKGANQGLLTGIIETQKEAPCNTAQAIAPKMNWTHPLNVSRVCIDNNGAFVLKWLYQDCPASTQSAWTPGFDVDQEHCMDVNGSVPGVNEGDILRISPQAEAGLRELSDPSLRYAPNSNVAAYECGGTTLSMGCSLISLVPVNPSIPPRASSVCIINQAGFVMDFYATDTRTHQATPRTGHYPINQKHCIDLSTAQGTQESDIFEVTVHAILGKTHQCDRNVQYEDNGLSVTYQCHGTTLDYSCRLL